jgi:hypothetical protein
VDTWHDFVLQVFYDADDRVQYIKSSATRRCSRCSSERGAHAAGRSRPAHVCRHGQDTPDADAVPCAYVFSALDLALWRPHAGEENTGRCASLGVARHGALGSRFAR